MDIRNIYGMRPSGASRCCISGGESGPGVRSMKEEMVVEIKDRLI